MDEISFLPKRKHITYAGLLNSTTWFSSEMGNIRKHNRSMLLCHLLGHNAVSSTLFSKGRNWFEGFPPTSIFREKRNLSFWMKYPSNQKVNTWHYAGMGTLPLESLQKWEIYTWPLNSAVSSVRAYCSFFNTLEFSLKVVIVWQDFFQTHSFVRSVSSVCGWNIIPTKK